MPDIPGATNSTFTPTSDQVGKRIRVGVRATNSAGTSAWVYSNWTNAVQAASAWSPTNLTSMVAWYDASDAASVSVSGTEVTQWNDKSGNGLHLTQATAARRPNRVGTLNGRNVINFDGDDVLVNESGTTLFANRGGVGIIAIFRGTYTAAGLKIVAGVSAGPTSNSGRSILAVNSSARVELSGRRLDADANFAHQVTGTNEYADNVPLMVIGMYDYTNSDVWGFVNATESAKRLDFSTSGTTSNTGSKMMVGGGSGLSSYFTGDIAEVFFMNTLPTAQEVTSIKSYVTSKWGIVTS